MYPNLASKLHRTHAVQDGPLDAALSAPSRRAARSDPRRAPSVDVKRYVLLEARREELRRAGRIFDARAQQRRAEQASAPRLESPDIEPRLEVRAAPPPLAQEHVQAQAQAHPQVQGRSEEEEDEITPAVPRPNLAALRARILQSMHAQQAACVACSLAAAG